MTEDELAGMEQRAEKATTGPWSVGSVSGQCYMDHAHGRARCDYQYTVSGAQGVAFNGTDRPVTLVGWDDRGPILSAGDSAFIAAARTDVPALVAEVRRLRALIDPCATTLTR